MGTERSEVEAARRRFERRWWGFRQQLSRQLGTVPRRPGWWILTLAAAVGLAVGLDLQRRRAEREESGEG